MTSILDRFPKQPEEFQPSNVSEFTILQISRKIGSFKDLRTSVIAAERYSLSAVIRAYQKAMSRPDPGLSFRSDIRQLTEQ
ncbi:MAG: hypothetical protein DMG65_12165 [Candidatus Angelobacter sp. Gp1-AA117]|nr:MAG: hypothetical protein DMG65_12165 [Candidatus Angelobacter sp. Gp1-AA117]